MTKCDGATFSPTETKPLGGAEVYSFTVKKMIRIGARKQRLLVLNVEKTSRVPEKTLPIVFRIPAYVDGCFQSARASYTEIPEFFTRGDPYHGLWMKAHW